MNALSGDVGSNHRLFGYPARQAPGDLYKPCLSESELAADDCDIDSLVRPVQNLGRLPLLRENP